MGASVVPLTPDAPRQAISTYDLDLDYHLNAASFRSRPVHEVQKAFELCGGGEGPGERPLRSLVTAYRLHRASALAVLEGFTHHCVICGARVQRMHVDGNFKAYCLKHATRDLQGDTDAKLDAPNATVLGDGIVDGLKTASGEAPVSTTVTPQCGNVSWKAAQQQTGRGGLGKGGRFMSLLVTALMVGVCNHRRTHFSVPLWRGETYLNHVTVLLMSLLLGATTVVDDIWCLVFRYLRAQSEDFADGIISALLRPGYKVRFMLPPSGSEGVGPVVSVTLTPAAPLALQSPLLNSGGGETAAAAVTVRPAVASTAVSAVELPVSPTAATAAAAAGGFAASGVPFGPVPPKPLTPLVPVTLHTELLRRFDALSAAAIRGGDPSGAVTLTFRGTIPLCHAKGHSLECQCVHGGEVVVDAGVAAERSEHNNAGISARAPVARSMCLSRFRFFHQEHAATSNLRLNADTPWYLLSTVVQQLGAVTNAAAALEKARTLFGGAAATDDVLRGLAARQLLRPETDEERWAAAAAEAHVKLLRLRNDCAALQGALTAMTECGVQLLASRRGSVPHAEYMQFINANFTVLVDASVDLRAVVAKRKIRDINHAAIVHNKLRAEIAADERSAIFRGGMAWSTPDVLIKSRFAILRTHATTAESLQEQLVALGGEYVPLECTVGGIQHCY
jgi:hypothetical protein